MESLDKLRSLFVEQQFAKITACRQLCLHVKTERAMGQRLKVKFCGKLQK
jgi:hypothetical protein